MQPYPITSDTSISSPISCVQTSGRRENVQLRSAADATRFSPGPLRRVASQLRFSEELEDAMPLKDKLEIGLREDAPYRKDNLPTFQIRGPEIPAGPGRSPMRTK